MRHAKLNKRFGRNNAQRRQLMNSLVRSLFISYKVKTTLEKAKESRKLAEKLITLAKKARLQDIRAINDILQDRTLTKKLVKEVAPLFASRGSGYTRVIRSGFRRGDGAALAILELTDMPVIEKKPKKDKKKEVKVQEKAVPEAKPSEIQPKEKTEPTKKLEPTKKKEPEKKPKATKPKKLQKPEKPTVPETPPKEEQPKEDKKGLFGKFKGLFNKDK